MSDSSPSYAPSGLQDQSEGVKRDKPPPVRAYQNQIRSLLGKRDHEDEAESKSSKRAATTPEPSHIIAPHALNSGPVDDTDESEFHSHPGIFTFDGASDKGGRRWAKPVTAIFIHAGAGYHSSANEEHHLKACSEAARVGMKALRAGRTATEATEAALVVLENKEITNAGYGSNLAIDGTVECDATIVDHLGRSGACGAVPNIKNPITLAKMILESSNKPLSLRRVPPNLLACDGARDFAKDSGMMLVSNDELISKNARDRFVRWRDDMKRAETHNAQVVPASRGEISPGHDQDPRKEHTKAILTATWNEGQPDSPTSTPPWLSPQNRQSPVPTDASTSTAPTSSKPTAERSPLSFLGSSLPYKLHRFMPAHNDECTDGHKSTGDPSIPSHDRACDEGDPPAPALAESYHSQPTEDEHDASLKYEDHIVDTVGAIAIDQLGHIAAGSSSGGIGMKHRGRIGPAALVGVSTAVVPAESNDPDAVTVAAVTSGTGEHMATTMAAQRCAERLYQGSVRGANGRDVSEDDENQILESFIVNDFLGHPGVRESTSTGAIGVMAVKKTPGGYYLYFGHNTESFALASMASNDQSPSCVMSRINDGGTGVAQGARKIHI